LKRPFLLRIMPPQLRTALYYRLYRSRRPHWQALFANAQLSLAPQFSMQLAETDEGHGEIAFTGFYELGLSRRIIADARRGGLIVDVGANYGYFTLLWLSGSPQNRAVAVEASPSNHAALRANIARNQCEMRVEVKELALGHEKGTARFWLGDQGQTGWGGFATEAGPAETIVPVTTLDELMPNDSIIDVLKIDVEGADLWVLKGAQQLLGQKRIRQIYFEQNLVRMKALGIREDEARNFLESMGYKVSALSAKESDIVEFEASPSK
jgi:FkbM family methyltransferase